MESTSPLYLRTFGRLELERRGEPVSSRASQKRRLALLAILAATPDHTVSRDKAVGFLWPDKDDEQARHLLSAALYDIRKHLGEYALESRGDHIALNPTHLSADVIDFDRANEAGEIERAVELYQAPFLDGVHFGNLNELDRWADQQRVTRRQAFHAALESVAESWEAAGDWTGAVEAWRARASADRYDSRVALRLLEALHSAGNVAGALQFARIHEQLLQDEFDAAPPAEFTEVVGALKKREEAGIPALDAAEHAPGASPADTPDGPGDDAIPPTSEPDGAVPARDPRPVPAPRARRTVEGRRTTWRRWVVAAALVVGAAGLLSSWLHAGRETSKIVRIAVVPFDSRAGGEEDLAYAQGVAESIIHRLGQVSGLRVKARSASFAMASVETPVAARRLEVGHVLTVSARREAGDVRIGVELSSADGVLLWSEQLDRPAGDVFATHDEIARSVLRELEVELSGAVPKTYGWTSNVDALDRFMRGRYGWSKRTPDGLFQALHYLGEAIEIDPRYARAHAALANVYNLLGAYDYGALPPDQAYPQAREAAEAALHLAPDLAEAHAALANTLFAYERDWEGAERAYRRALELDPGYPEAHHWYALFLTASGEHDQALREIRIALALDSVSLVMQTSLARQFYFRGEYERALAAYDRALTADPGFVTAQHGRGATLLQLGRSAEAVAAFEQALSVLGRRPPITVGLLAHALARDGKEAQARALLEELQAARKTGSYVSPVALALIHLGLDDHDATVKQLEAALAENSGVVAFLDVEPLVNPLRDHSGFQALRVRAGLPGKNAPLQGSGPW